MTDYKKRQVRLPADLWAKLDAECKAEMDTITVHGLIRQALEARYGSVGSNNDARPTVSV